jgi:LysM repeat protein
MQYQIGSGDTY